MNSNIKLMDPVLAAIETETSSTRLAQISEDCLVIAAMAGLKSMGIPITTPIQQRLVSQLVLALAREERMQLASSGMMEYANTLH